MTEPAVLTDHAPGLERAFETAPEEHAYEIVDVEGRVPELLRGTYYLNGPARFSRGALRYRHWLDGDGMVAALRFEGGRVSFAARYVRTAKWLAEQEAGQPLFRTFGTSFAGDRLVRGIALESPVNVSVCPWQGTLLALGEQGLPYELDPETLATRGLYTFGGSLNPVSPFAAHAKIDPASGELFNFGISFSATQPCLHLYRFGPEGNQLYRRRIPLDLPCSLHDFVLGARHAIFHLGPYVLDMEALSGGRTLMESLRWQPERGSRLLVIDRETGAPVATVPVGERYMLHGINAFEDEKGRLAVDVVELDRPVYDQYQEVPDLFMDVAPGRPVRFLLDLEEGRVVEKREIDYDRAPDFPAIDPRLAGRPYDDFWMLGISATGQPGRKFFDQLAHLSWREGRPKGIYSSPPGVHLGGEPAFAPDPAREEGGFVFCQELDTRPADTGTGAFLIFDAFDVARGPIARLRLRAPIHLGFHAVFHGPRGAEEWSPGPDRRRRGGPG